MEWIQMSCVHKVLFRQVERGVDVAIACRMMRRVMAPSPIEKVDVIVLLTGEFWTRGKICKVWFG